jgi:hypothetical protein
VSGEGRTLFRVDAGNLFLAAIPSLPNLPLPPSPRRRNCSPLAARVSLATHRSPRHSPSACPGALQSAAAGVTSAGPAHRAAAATTRRKRQRSGAPTPCAFVGRAGSPCTTSGRRRASTNQRRAPTKVGPSPAPPYLCRWLLGAPATTQGHRAHPRHRAYLPRACPA